MWNHGAVTDIGRTVLAKAAGGKTLVIDGAQSGTGTVAETELRTCTSLAGTTHVLGVINYEVKEQGVCFTVQITSPGDGYTAKQIGLFGHVDNEDSCLLAIYQDETGIAIPDNEQMPDFMYLFYAQIQMNNSGSISITLDPSVLVSQQQLYEELNNRMPGIINDWLDEHVMQETGYVIDDSLTVPGAAADAKKTGDALNALQEETAEIPDIKEDVNNLKSSFDDVTEDYGLSEETVVVPVELDLSDVRVDKFTTDEVGQLLLLNDSTVTSAVIRAFLCEANKTYTLTITNGAEPAQIANRATVVISTPETSNATVTWVQRSTNTANAQDVVEFTPTVSGYVFFNLDKNYQSIAVTTTETHQTTEKTAVDKVARDELNDLTGLPARVTELEEDVEAVQSTMTEITETYVDGDVAVPVELDLSYTRIGYRTDGSIGASVSLDTTHNLGFSSSTVTSCVARCFECETGKRYRLTVTNGATPASIAERATVVIVDPVPNKYYGDIVYVLRSRNTSAVKDTLDFTAPNSGYVFFNVDKNYQSVAVAELQDNIVTTAVDDKARNSIGGVSKYVLNGQVEKTLTWESGSFDAALDDVSGAGYRSNLITGVKGCAVCIKVDPSYSFVYGDGENALMTVYGIYVIHPETDTIRIGLTDTPETVGFEMRVYTERGHKGKYDVIVAASDSSDEDKAIADIVCDGVNDELDLQFAVNWNFWRRQRTIYADRCNVLLLTGTYNIDNFTQQYSANGQLMRNRYGVVFGNHPHNNYQHYKYRMSIEGCYETEHSQDVSSVVINVTAAALATLSTEINNAVFGLALSADGETGSFTSNGMTMVIKNLMIYTRGVANKIIAIDAYQAGSVTVKDCDIWATASSAYLPSATIETAPEGSIGIRAGRGSCMGVRQRIEGCRINGFREGIALCGEHFIVQDCLELACYYGFTLNNYPTNGAVQHPNVFIGNSIEQCLKMAKFVESGNNATLVYIGGSVENKLTQDSPAVPMKPIEIAQTTQFRGRIESDGLASPYSSSLFYEGYGQTFEQTIYPYWQA